MADVNPIPPPPRPGSVPSPFGLAYTLDCRVSLASEHPGTGLAWAGRPDALAYTYQFTIDVRLLRAAGAGAILLLLLLAGLPRIMWRAVGRGARTGLARVAAAAAVAAVLCWGVAHFVWRDVAVPATTLLPAGRARATSAVRRCVAAAPAWRRWVRENAAVGWRAVVEVSKNVVLAVAAIVFASVVVWVLRCLVGVMFGRGEDVESPGLTMADYDEIVRAAKARCERPITDWTWADGYVTRPCRFPRCVMPGEA